MAQPTSADMSASRRLIPLVVTLFFVWGFATVLVDTLIPKLKALFLLSYTEVMLTQFCFFLAYLVVSIPAGWLLARIGYLRGIVAGLLLMAVGCLMFAPAVLLGVYPGFLAALFVMAGGITILQVAANPLVAILGQPETSSSRLVLAQAFNSLGTTIAPILGSVLILSGGLSQAPDPATLSAQALDTYRRTEAYATQLPFLGIAALLAVLAVAFWWLRRRPIAPPPQAVAGGAHSFLIDHPRLALGAVSIFLYVGAEVSIGSLLINYLMQGSTLALDPLSAGKLVSFYWGGAMVGRFIGSAVLMRVRAGTVLAACAVAAAALAAISSLSIGLAAAVTILGVGLFNSIMFPTIFTLAIERLGEDTPRGSGILCLAIVGGAIVPIVTGYVADHGGLAVALLVPAVCYLWIALYGAMARFGLIDARAPAA